MQFCLYPKGQTAGRAGHRRKTPTPNSVEIHRNACQRSRVEGTVQAWGTQEGFLEGMVPNLTPNIKYIRDKGNEGHNRWSCGRQRRRPCPSQSQGLVP